MITRVATLIIWAVTAILALLDLAWLEGWLSGWAFSAPVFALVFVGAVAVIVRFFARRALPRLPPDRSK